MRFIKTQRLNSDHKMVSMRLVLVVCLLGAVSTCCYCCWAATEGQTQVSTPQASLSVAVSGPSPDGAVNALTSEQLQLQQLLANLTPQQVLQFGMSPIKYLMPNTVQGATQDLTNGYYVLSNGANKGLDALQSQYASSAFNPNNVLNQFQSIEVSLVARLQQQTAIQEELLRRTYELVTNPEQLCKQLADRGQQTLEQMQASQKAQQATDQSGSFMRKLSFPFGK